MEIITGRQQSAIKTCIYGPEGIGKTTFASHFPRPVFIDTEGSTRHMDVHRTPRPSSFAMLLEQVRWFRDHPDAYGTLVVDTADWAEQLCAADLCARTKKTGIEDFGYHQLAVGFLPAASVAGEGMEGDQHPDQRHGLYVHHGLQRDCHERGGVGPRGLD